MVYVDNIKPLSKDQHLKHKQWPIETESPRFSGFEITHNCQFIWCYCLMHVAINISIYTR